MFYVYAQEENKIEFVLSEEVTENEFRQIIHQLESLCTMYNQINVLMDASQVSKYDFKILLDEYDFYKEYKSHLYRIAVVSDRKFQNFMAEMFNKFSDTEIKVFESDDIEDARKWIFPSRLPS